MVTPARKTGLSSATGVTTPVRPTENANRTDVRWVALTDARGAGLLASGAENFSAHWFTTMDLENARHTTDLVKRDFITLNLDHAHNGIGSASCGPGPWPQYLLRPEEFRFAVRLRPFSRDYQGWSVTYDVEAILQDIHDANADAWSAAS